MALCMVLKSLSLTNAAGPKARNVHQASFQQPNRIGPGNRRNTGAQFSTSIQQPAARIKVLPGIILAGCVLGTHWRGQVALRLWGKLEQHDTRANKDAVTLVLFRSAL